MSLIPIIVPKPPIVFQSAFLKSLASSASVGAGNITLLQKVYGGGRGGKFGTHLKMIITPPTLASSFLTINGAWIGFASGSSSSVVSFDGTQVQHTWNGGQAGGTWNSTGGPYPEPDEIAYAIPDGTKALIMAFNLALGSSYKRSASMGSNFSKFIKTTGAPQEAANTLKSGYTQTAGDLAIVGQLWIGS